MVQYYTYVALSDLRSLLSSSFPPLAILYIFFIFFWEKSVRSFFLFHASGQEDGTNEYPHRTEPYDDDDDDN